MRRIAVLAVLVLFSAVAMAAAQSSSARAEQALVGKWAGSFDGEATGKWSMAISRDAAKKLTGTLELSPDDRDGYSVPFKSIVVAGKQVTLVHDSPDGEVEVHLDATLDGKSLKGTWRALDATKNPVERGNFEGTKP